MTEGHYKSTQDFLTNNTRLGDSASHRHRLSVLCSMVVGSMCEQCSSFVGLGSSMAATDTSDRQTESMAKQAKRWCSSKWTDWDTFYAPYVMPLLGYMAVQTKELILIIDGSETASGCVTLMLSALYQGHALPLAWITRDGKKGHFPEEMHLEVVKMAKKILPCTGKGPYRVVLLGDGEFDGAELRKLCRSYGWEYVLRTALDRKIACGCGEIAAIGELQPVPGAEHVFVEDACEGDNAVLWHGNGFKDPIPLLTNMDLGAMACVYYKRRFSIETLFKRLKSSGFHIHKSRVKGAYRVSNLLIVISLAFIISFAIGIFLKLQHIDTLAKFVRRDKVKNMSPILLAHEAITFARSKAMHFSKILTKSWCLFFSKTG